MAGAALYGVSLVIALPAAAVMWFAGLCCAVAAFFDSAHERRMKEMAPKAFCTSCKKR
jgi:hypothetical protein